MKNYVTTGGGILTFLSMFLPFSSVMGMGDVNGMAMGWVAYFWMGCGAVIAIVGLLGKKMLNILSLLLGIAVAGLAIKYQMDLKDAGADVGIGIWVMLGGGVLGVIGSIMSLTKKAV